MRVGMQWNPVVLGRPRKPRWHACGTFDDLPTNAILSALQHVEHVSIGESYACAVFRNGSGTCWGAGDNYVLGYGTTDDVENAGQGGLLAVGELRSIAAGWSHTCAVLRNGSCLCWGYAYSGALGAGNMDTIISPAYAQVLSVGGFVVQMSVGASHSCALLNDGNVRCWGLGSTLGNGITVDIKIPEQSAFVTFNGAIRQISSGAYHTCGVYHNGAAKCFGMDIASYGAVGAHGLGVTNASDVGFINAPPIRMVATGYYHTCLLLMTGEVRCFGMGLDGRLGIGFIGNVDDPALAQDVELEGLSQVIGAGNGHTCALSATADVECWGW